MSASLTRWIIISVIAVSILLLQMQCKQVSVKSEPVYASLNPENKYVGMQTCRECHASIYETFIETGMGKSIDLASRNKSSAAFDHQPVYDSHLDFWYRPFWQDDSLRIMEYRLDGRDTIHKRTETVTYIIGSGQHTNSHLMNTGGYLNQMPMTFYTQKGKWDLPPGFENGGNSRFGRLIGLECMSCHNSYPVFEMGSENKYDFVDKGIGCERCHGPGETHVREKREGKAVDVVTGIDYSIVNPAKLPIDLQLDVCQRCHIQGNAVLKEGKSFFDFRPGMQLSQVMDVYMPVYRGREEEHIMASHVERMKLSKCFTATISEAEKSPAGELRPYKNALTCVTCHNPHISVRKTDTGHFNNACNNCHSSAKHNTCKERPEILALENNDCVKCHMPASGATDIPHVSVHDHFIRVPVKDKTINDIKEFIGISCINNPAPDNESRGKAFLAYYEKFNFGKQVLDSAKKYFPDKNPEEIRQNFGPLIHLAFLENNFDKVVQYAVAAGNDTGIIHQKSFDNSDAWTSYRIGDSYMIKGDNKMAERYLLNAYNLAPLHPEFCNKYAYVLSANGKHDEAKKILEASMKAYPKFAPVVSNLGYLVLLTEGDTLKARKLYDEALALDPDYEQAIINKAGLYIATSRKAEAQRLLSNYLKRKPGSVKVKEILDQLTKNS